MTMSSSLIDSIDYNLTSSEAISHQRRRHKIIHSAIITTIAAAYLLNMSETSTKRKNAKWDEEVEVFQLMEFLAQHASVAGDGGNFPASLYNEAASHIAQYQGSGGNAKTGDQVETKYKLVCLFNRNNCGYTNISSSSSHSTNSLSTTEIIPQAPTGTMRRVQIS